jgi:hypothetical protein
MRLTACAIVLAMAGAAAASAQAADAVTDAIQAAYGPYRAALFRTNGKSQPEAQQALVQAQQAWASVTQRFATQPPAPYDRDASFASTLAQVGAVYEKAAAEIRDNKLPVAHETLEAARDLLADLRRRNGVVVFSDHMNAYHAEMEHLLIEGPKLLAGPQGLQQLMAQVGTLDYLVRQLRAQAPSSLATNAEFDGLLKDVEGSVKAVRAAVLSQDLVAVKDTMGKVKAPYSKLFLKFG